MSNAPLTIAHGPALALQTATAGAPEWIHVLPAGTIATRDGRGPYTLQDPQAVIAATKGLGMDLGIDRDHKTDLGRPGEEVPAEGWIKELQARPDGLWGRVEWTARGRDAVAGRLYRYVSPVFEHAKNGAIQRIVRVSLTNNPNLYLTSLNSRGNPMDDLLKQMAATLGMPEDSTAEAVTEAVVAHIRTLIDQVRAVTGIMATIARELGLEDQADADAITARVTELAAQAARRTTAGTAEPDPSRYVPMSQFMDLSRQLAAMQKQMADAAVETVLNEARAQRKVTAANEGWAQRYASRDPEGFRQWMAVAPIIAPAPGVQLGARPPGGAGGALDAADLAVCQAMGLSPEVYRKSREV